ncbi:MAG: purine-nucleoside phosphorylase [Alistipes sp.]|jgi:purine-nucleoside phosphorylase|nr:purine-nucleoside phosphorylase [Alistipes sp.]
MLQRIKKTASFIQGNVAAVTGGAFEEPEVGIILGTGLGGLVGSIDIAASIDYADIPDFPVSTVEGHRGRMVFGTLGGRRVVAMQGRFHYYEGYEPWQVVFPVRVMKFLGVRTLMVSNAAGGINPNFRVGDIMVITDHINLIPNPLVGPNIAELGPRFPDMHNCYDAELRAVAERVAEAEGIALRHGVYVGGTGPTFETQAEYRYFGAIGGDAAGMSTTPEVIAARHMGLTVFGASIITNAAFSDEAGDHEDVQRQGALAEAKMTALFAGIIGAGLPAASHKTI